MQIVIASGKGGTGKTTVASNLAFVLSGKYDVTLADCDVEEPNLGIFFPCNPEVQTVQVEVPEVLIDRCVLCGTCGDFCRFGALAVLKERVLFFQNLCHSCEGCFRVCPSDALQKKLVRVGEILTCRLSDSLVLVTGRLDEGDIRTTTIIRSVRKKVSPDPVVIIDSPPGTACPFIETVDETNLCVLVTEPTPFGLHDLSVAVNVLRVLRIRCLVVINRSDGNDELIEQYCTENELPVLMCIPFDFKLLNAQNTGKLISREDKEWYLRFSELGEKIMKYAMEDL